MARGLEAGNGSGYIPTSHQSKMTVKQSSVPPSIIVVVFGLLILLEPQERAADISGWKRHRTTNSLFSRASRSRGTSSRPNASLKKTCRPGLRSSLRQSSPSRSIHSRRHPRLSFPPSGEFVRPTSPSTIEDETAREKAAATMSRDERQKLRELEASRSELQLKKGELEAKCSGAHPSHEPSVSAFVASSSHEAPPYLEAHGSSVRDLEADSLGASWRHAQQALLRAHASTTHHSL
ncbi:hypothetical protein IWZ01DRAFT_486061 [Phyllosticta capitalensis]